MKKVFVGSIGCEESRLDAQKLINLIRSEKDYDLSNDLSQADIILYNACGHLKQDEKESRLAIKIILSKKRDSSKLIVWGCLQKINPSSIDDIYRGPITGPEESLHILCDQLGIPKRKISDFNANTLNPLGELISPYLSPRKKISDKIGQVRRKFHLIDFRREIRLQNTWYIKIESGCKNNCTYCSDKLAYKSIKSESFENIFNQFELGLKKGYRDFMFVGRDLGSYGYDVGLNLTDLLDEILDIFPNHDYKIMLPNISPSTLVEMYPNLDHSLSSGKILEIGSHIQSGSNRILKLMGKNVDINEWLSIMNNIEELYPEINLATSIMVGFPRETVQDHKQTISLLNKLFFDRIKIYIYSERPNLPSIKLNGNISEEIKKKRYDEMNYYATLNMTKKRIKRSQFFAIPLLKLLLAMRALVRV
jgi:threonylcarbamoyladenosine tRNA methylthiotransferase MtaB